MTPEKKAKELVYKFYDEIKYIETAKQCALIAVNEILNEFPNGIEGSFEEKRKYYWIKVKQEIENL